MKQQPNEPMANIFSQVHTTKDYSMFKTIEGNRQKNELHLNRLKKSMSENYLFTIIIVNEKYQIIDGQHRFEIIKEFKLPLNYIICKGYGLQEVHILNQTSKTWNSDDYLEGYCRLNYPHYLKYAQFKKRYGFGHRECFAILTDSASPVGAFSTHKFYEGKFQIKNYEKSCEVADKIEIISPYYADYKKRSFVNAMLKLFKNKNFEFTEFIQKLKNQPTALIKCATSEQYILLIEEIYNYRRRDKISLKY